MTDTTPVVHLDARRPIDAYTLRVAAERIAGMERMAEADLSNPVEPADDERSEAGRVWGLSDACIALHEWACELNASELNPEVECRLRAIAQNAQAALDGSLPLAETLAGIQSLAKDATGFMGGAR